MEPFPTSQWKQSLATFVPSKQMPPPAAPAETALIFVFAGDRFVLGDLRGRGWCIPSGKIESGETPEAAARREAWEEVGATLGEIHLLGHYLFTERETGVQSVAPAYIADSVRLQPAPQQYESQGVRLVRLDDLPRCYYLWDDLVEAVFRYAFTRHAVLSESRDA